jgi:hypothetical protein
MALRREYYPSEVLTILRESDSRNSPFNNAPGHCLSAHVLISTDGMIARHGGVGPGAKPRTATAFKRFIVPASATAPASAASSSDMALAATHILNSPHGQQALAALDAGTARRVSIVGPPPTQLLGSTALGDISVRQTTRIGSVNAFNAALVKTNGVTHNENMAVRLNGGGQNIWMLVDRIDADRIHIHTCSPVDPGAPNYPVGWQGTP